MSLEISITDLLCVECPGVLISLSWNMPRGYIIIHEGCWMPFKFPWGVGGWLFSLHSHWELAKVLRELAL